ncbi:protein kinase [Kribbella sp. NPDC058245]|uniref:protein kinase domain-containing protein n=1 Tax=Kribbella sp. NPDC058245 TaxID=3346399 RepID=UPI0036E0FCD1
MALEDLAGYSLRRRLGSGSAGTLWQVRDLATGRHAVLKRIPVTAIQREEQFRDELMVLQRIHHPHVARVLEVRETASEWLIFSQYVVALSLTKVLSRRGSLSPGELVTLLSPLADALHYLHRCGLIHGHVTPPNVLIDVEGRPILTDAALHSLNIRPLTDPPSEPPSPANDRQALAALALHAGGPATLFTPALFTETPSHHLAAHLLTLTTPEPILVGDDDDLTPDLHPSALPPSDDDPIETSRGPLAPPPSEPPTRPALQQPTTPELPAPKPLPSRPKRPRLPKLIRRTPEPAANPLSRLAPTSLTKTHVVLPTRTHIIGTTHIEPAISWSTPRPTPDAPPAAPEPTPPSPHAPIADRRDPQASPFALGARPARSAESAPPRTLTRRCPWRRRHTWWGRLRTAWSTSNREASGSPVGRFRGLLAKPTFGVAGAVGLGLAVLLVLALAARLVLDPSDTAIAASEQPSTTPSTAHPTNSTGSASSQPTTPASPPTPTSTGTPTTSGPSRTHTPGPERSVAEWLRTLRALDLQRAQAFRTLDVALLDNIYIPGSTPWRSDRALLADYRSKGVRIHGLQLEIDKTTITRQTPTTVILRATDHLAAGQAVDKTGATTPLPPGTPTTHLITLTTTPTPTDRQRAQGQPPAWRIAAITPP